MHVPTTSMRSARFFIFLLSGVLLIGCATIESGSHHDVTASFDHYQTFSWIADQPMITGSGEAAAVSPLTQKMIVAAIETELESNGFMYLADRESADFVLSYTVGTRDKIEPTSYPSVYRGAWGRRHLYGPDYYEADVVLYTYTEGTLGVDVFDGASKEPVWHGWAKKTISSSDRQDPTPSIEKAVAAVFKDFPPKD